MNVLLAEAEIPYDRLVEMDDINPEMPRADVALVIGANDVVNPAARLDKNSPIYGMPIIDADKARVVLAIKRSMNPGFAGIENELYYDPKTAMLFGDGAGAVVVAGGELEIGCGGFVLGSDATQADMLYAERVDPMLRMEGREVYRHAIRRMVAATNEAIERAGLTIDDVDLFVAHQANVRILQSAANELGLPPEKLMVNIDRVANTSSASIPLALAEAERDGRLKPGAIVALSAFGAGFVWGSGVISWKERAHVCA
jgi:3-oxoacyl-(acyl-carrier-protein) synthase III